MSDMIIKCKKCHSRFYFTEGEQRYYKKNNLHIPSYCKNCRGNKTRTPKSCSSCYFLTYSSILGIKKCKRNGKRIKNDAPCKHWARR